MTGCSYSSVTASRDTPEEAKKKKKTGGNCLVAVRMPLVWLRHRPDGRDGARLLFVRPQPGERERSCLNCEQPPVGDDRCCGPANDRNRARQGRDACRRPEQGAVSGLLLRACGSGRTATLPVKPSVASRSAACCLLLAACRRCCCCLGTGVGISLSFSCVCPLLWFGGMVGWIQDGRTGYLLQTGMASLRFQGQGNFGQLCLTAACEAPMA